MWFLTAIALNESFAINKYVDMFVPIYLFVSYMYMMCDFLLIQVNLCKSVIYIYTYYGVSRIYTYIYIGMDIICILSIHIGVT